MQVREKHRAAAAAVASVASEKEGKYTLQTTALNDLSSDSPISETSTTALNDLSSYSHRSETSTMALNDLGSDS